LVRDSNKKDGKDEYKFLLEKYKGKWLEGIVDQVITGSTLRIELLIPNKINEHISFITSLCGCNAPRTAIQFNNNNDEKDNRNRQMRRKGQKAESFGPQAKEFVSEKLLHQKVKIKMMCNDKNGNIYSMIRHVKGDIAPMLLRSGFAYYENWSVVDNKYKELLLNNYKYAKTNKQGIWESKSPDKDTSEEALTAQVTKIINGDTLEVSIVDSKSNSDDRKESKKSIPKRFTLASIKAPNVGALLYEKDRELNDIEKAEQIRKQYWAREAKEYLRKRLIGKKVELFIEYPRAIDNPVLQKRFGAKVQEFVTIYINNKENIANSLVKEGLAEVIYHRTGDKRSKDYQLLQKSEIFAKSRKKGLHNSKAKLREYIDYSKTGDNVANVAQRINLVQSIKNKNVDGVVEYVFSGGRTKIYLPDESIVIILLLFNHFLKHI